MFTAQRRIKLFWKMAALCQCDITESTNSTEHNFQEEFDQEKRCKLRVKYRLPLVTFNLVE